MLVSHALANQRVILIKPWLGSRPNLINPWLKLICLKLICLKLSLKLLNILTHHRLLHLKLFKKQHLKP